MRWILLVALLAPVHAPAAFGRKPFRGLTLISPFKSRYTYLVDMDGNTVQTWCGANTPACAAYLLPDGSLIRPCVDPGGLFDAPGAGGHIQTFDSAGTLVWDYYYSGYQHQQHHDVQPMPNGNVLLLAWERKTQQEAMDAGRRRINGEMWPTHIVELQPVGATDANIVWEWHLWDHLVQDVDPSKPNHGVVADHPELLDINYTRVGGILGDGNWIHANSIDYNEYFDQIVFSARKTNEFYIIDHSTTTAEAAGHTGGTSGRGGDFLYRWGNPQAYDRGSTSDQYFYGVHGVNWIDCGFPGAGNVLVFNNGDHVGLARDWSSVAELVLPLNAACTYDIRPGEPFGPNAPSWIYSPFGFYGGTWGCGAFRLPNGDTLVCAGESGYIFELDDTGAIVWDCDYGEAVFMAPRYWKGSLEAFRNFMLCFTSADEEAADCKHADFDCDGDVDLTDFAAFLGTLNQLVGP